MNQIRQRTPLGQIQLDGFLQERLARAYDRLLHRPPYDNPEYVLHSVCYAPGSDSHFPDWSGDLSGRVTCALATLGAHFGKRPPQLESLLERILAAQHADGHFGKELPPGALDHAQIYGNGWLLVSLCENASQTGDARLLDAARRLAGYFEAAFPVWNTEDARHSCTDSYAKDVLNYSHALEGIVHLYRLTAEARWLRLARDIADHLMLTYEQADHSHNFLSTVRGIFDLYGVTGEAGHRQLVRRAFDLVRANDTVPTGGVFERFRHHERDEGCSVADWFSLAMSLYETTGESSYLETAEGVCFNHLLYNQHENGGFTVGRIHPSLARRQEEAVWCCTMHGTRCLAAFAGGVVHRTGRDVFFSLPVACRGRLPECHLEFTVRSDFPFAPSYSIRLKKEDDLPRHLYLRMPSRSTNHRVSLNRRSVPLALRDGFARVALAQSGEYELAVAADYLVEIQQANRTVDLSALPEATLLRDVCVYHGPFLLVRSEETFDPYGTAAPVRHPALMLALDDRNRIELPVAPQFRPAASGPFAVVDAWVLGDGEWNGRDRQPLARRWAAPVFLPHQKQGGIYRHDCVVHRQSSRAAPLQMDTELETVP